MSELDDLFIEEKPKKTSKKQLNVIEEEKTVRQSKKEEKNYETPVETKKEYKERSAEANLALGFKEDNRLYDRMINSNIDWTKIDKEKFLEMSKVYAKYIGEYNITAVNLYPDVTTKHTKYGEKPPLLTTSADWDKFLKLAVVAKFKEDLRNEARRVQIAQAEATLQDVNADKNAIERAKIVLSNNKELMNEKVQTGQNEGIIVSHVFLTDIEEHIEREKTLKE